MADLPNFDYFVSSYQDNVRDALGRFGGDSSYYIERKVEILGQALSSTSISRILDFGCGIGQAIPFLDQAFEPEVLHGSDESEESLKIAHDLHPLMTPVNPSALEDESYDLIFVANVMHHVEPDKRAGTIDFLCRKLRRGGWIAIFEHNPINPLTQRIVSNCSFDKGVTLLRRPEVERLIESASKMTIRHSGYFLFFPEPLRFLNWSERTLRRVPLGGQHYVFSQFNS